MKHQYIIFFMRHIWVGARKDFLSNPWGIICGAFGDKLSLWIIYLLSRQTGAGIHMGD